MIWNHQDDDDDNNMIMILMIIIIIIIIDNNGKTNDKKLIIFDNYNNESNNNNNNTVVIMIIVIVIIVIIISIVMMIIMRVPVDYQKSYPTILRACMDAACLIILTLNNVKKPWKMTETLAHGYRSCISKFFASLCFGRSYPLHWKG